MRSADELLRGDVNRLVSRLERERDAAAEGLRFEQAGELHRSSRHCMPCEGSVDTYGRRPGR